MHFSLKQKKWNHPRLYMIFQREGAVSWHSLRKYISKGRRWVSKFKSGPNFINLSSCNYWLESITVWSQFNHWSINSLNHWVQNYNKQILFKKRQRNRSFNGSSFLISITKKETNQISAPNTERRKKVKQYK